MASKVNIDSVKDHFNSTAAYYGVNEEYSPISHIFATRLQKVIELIGDLDGLNVLSVGTGPAPLANYVIEKKGNYFGVDLSRNMLYEAKKRHEDKALALTVGNVMNLPLVSGSSDLLLCLGALEYVDNVEQVIEEFSRVLKTNASVVISMQNKISLYRLWDRTIYSGFLFDFIRKIRHRPISGEPLEILIPMNNLVEKLCRHSFTITDLIYYNFNLLPKPLDRLFPKLSVLTSRKLEFLSHARLGVLAADFIIKAQKVIEP